MTQTKLFRTITALKTCNCSLRFLSLERIFNQHNGGGNHDTFQIFDGLLVEFHVKVSDSFKFWLGNCMQRGTKLLSLLDSFTTRPIPMTTHNYMKKGTSWIVCLFLHQKKGKAKQTKKHKNHDAKQFSYYML